jgi:hypothetical protein
MGRLKLETLPAKTGLVGFAPSLRVPPEVKTVFPSSVVKVGSVNPMVSNVSVVGML